MNALTIREAEDLFKSNIESDIAIGVRIVEDLAKSGDGEAKYALASWIVNESYGYKFDLDYAEQLFSESCDSGYPKAYYDLAALQLYKSGPDRFRRAFGLLVCGAISGDADATKQVASAMSAGRGCFKDERSARFLNKIASQMNKQVNVDRI